eukprot:9084805-Lingulodinium_polyedra.AAC.1
MRARASDYLGVGQCMSARVCATCGEAHVGMLDGIQAVGGVRAARALEAAEPAAVGQRGGVALK